VPSPRAKIGAFWASSRGPHLGHGNDLESTHQARVPEVNHLIGAKPSREDRRVLGVEPRDPFARAGIVFVERKIRGGGWIPVRVGDDHRHAGLADVVGELQEGGCRIDVRVLCRQHLGEHLAGALRLAAELHHDALRKEDVGSEQQRDEHHHDDDDAATHV